MKQDGKGHSMSAAAGGFQVATMASMMERLGCEVDHQGIMVGDVLVAGVDAVDWIPVHSLHLHTCRERHHS